MSKLKPAKRKGGKRLDGNYQQLTAYVRKETHMAVRIALLPTGQEISELVDELLAAWLSARPAEPTADAVQRREKAVQRALLFAERELAVDPDTSPEEHMLLMARFLAKWVERIDSDMDARPEPRKKRSSTGKAAIVG
jgi:hypothetical protein